MNWKTLLDEKATDEKVLNAVITDLPRPTESQRIKTLELLKAAYFVRADPENIHLFHKVLYQLLVDRYYDILERLIYAAKIVNRLKPFQKEFVEGLKRFKKSKEFQDTQDVVEDCIEKLCAIAQQE